MNIKTKTKIDGGATIDDFNNFEAIGKLVKGSKTKRPYQNIFKEII